MRALDNPASASDPSKTFYDFPIKLNGIELLRGFDADFPWLYQLF